ncbi:MAG: hypothetical protein E7561_00680 [Ruminococcaceae bacterium]|nr:hypothetical protein [Oscillospiraceae bacterium]
MWEIDVGFQMLGLVCSLPLGITAAFLYDFLRALNKSFKPKAPLVFLFDVLYWLILAIIYFTFFMVFTNGQIRMYVFLGSVSGFIFSRLTLSRVFLFLLLGLFKIFKVLGNKLRAFFRRFTRFALKRIKISKKTLKKPFIKRKKA